MIKQISNWIREQVNNAKAEGVIVGISGGIDSAVVYELCKIAVGDKAWSVDIPIDNAYPPYKYLIEQYNPSLMAKANLKARLRMCILYLKANTHNLLVAGTGNKSELVMGYFTKYGDGGVDILPIGDLTKTEVKELAKRLGIPQEIINKPPSAGLWEGQTDEKEMGITYEMIDKVLMFQEKTKHKREGIPIWKR
jgi:NAD+ synthase